MVEASCSNKNKKGVVRFSEGAVTAGEKERKRLAGRFGSKKVKYRLSSRSFSSKERGHSEADLRRLLNMQLYFWAFGRPIPALREQRRANMFGISSRRKSERY